MGRVTPLLFRVAQEGTVAGVGGEYGKDRYVRRVHEYNTKTDVVTCNNVDTFTTNFDSVHHLLPMVNELTCK